MYEERKRVLIWELSGIPFIVALGSALHFAFAWSGGWPPVAVFAAVNESVWEHLKLAFWPALLWTMIEKRTLRLEQKRFWAVKGFALLVAPLAIVLIFSIYTGILGKNLLYLDIGTFVVAIILGQLASAWLMLNEKAQTFLRLGHVLLVCQLTVYSTLTYFPPRLSYFMDGRSNTYGIPLRLN